MDPSGLRLIFVVVCKLSSLQAGTQSAALASSSPSRSGSGRRRRAAGTPTLSVAFFSSAFCFRYQPFPESSSQVGKLLRFEEISKERHERLKQEGEGGIRDPIYCSFVTDSWLLCLAGLKSEEDWAVLFSSGGRIAQRACSSTYLGLGWVGVRRRQTRQTWGLQGEIW